MIVRQPSRYKLPVKVMEAIVKHLFRMHQPVILIADIEDMFLYFSMEELKDACAEKENNPHIQYRMFKTTCKSQILIKVNLIFLNK